MIEMNLTRNISVHMERGRGLFFFLTSREKIQEVCFRVYPTDGEVSHRHVGKGIEEREYRYSILLEVLLPLWAPFCLLISNFD